MPLPRRLRKHLRDALDLSLAEIDEALQAGRVTCPAHVGELAESTLIFDGDQVFLDGSALPKEKPACCFVLNKPKNVTTTANDPGGKRDLKEWLQRLPAGVFPVGRLDRETTGALLFTNDGDLASALLQPQHSAEKLYWLWLNESLQPDDPRLKSWQEGLPLLGQVLRAHRVQLLRSTPDMSELLVTLREGKNRQLRRMARASDFRLLHLHRLSIGSVGLDGLELGQVRQLNEHEVKTLWKSAGGPEQVHEAKMRALRQKARLARQDGRPHLRLEAWLESCESKG